MQSSVWSWTLAEFRDRTAFPSPTPSGGSAAPVCAALGLGLVLMVLEITRKGADAELAAALDPLLSSGRDLLARLSAHADADIAAYQEHMRARSLPKGTDEEKAVRHEQMQTTLVAATEAPLAAGRDIAAALGIAGQAAKLCKRHILSDLVAGADLLTGSLSAVLRSVDANIPGLSDLALRERFRKEHEALAAAASGRGVEGDAGKTVRLKSLAAAVVLAEERERRRIGAGLHDDVGQTLAIVKIKLGELRQSAAESASAQKIEEIRDLLDQAIRSTRTLNFELSSPVLYELGLAAALQELGERMEKDGGIRFHFRAECWREPSAELAIVLYRIVRELLFNVVKHARAGNVRMAIDASGDQVRIVIEDDGVGFAAANQVFDASGGFGLFTVREQLIHVGGRLEIDSSPGEGTRVRLFAPSMP